MRFISPACVLIFILCINLISAEFKCAQSLATVTFVTDLDLSTLTPDQLDEIVDCTDSTLSFPTVTCGSAAATITRQVACVIGNIIQADNTQCISGAITAAPVSSITDYTCTYFCSSKKITPQTDLSTLVLGTDYAACDSTNFFTASSCRENAPETRTRTVFCAVDDKVEGPKCTTTTTPPNTIPESTTPNDTSTCVHFFFCANTNDEFVECGTPTLITELCTANPFNQATQTCIVDPSDPSVGTYELPYTTQCAVGNGCKNAQDEFDQSLCENIYQYQTTTEPCTTAKVPQPKFECPCTPQPIYQCALTKYTLAELEAKPSLLVACDDDALFPASSKVQACNDVIAHYYRSVVCVDIDGTLTLMDEANIKDNQTPCKPLPLPPQSKDYPGQLECTYAIKCGSYNETISTIGMDSPDCPRFNSNIPSPCFTDAQIDIFASLPMQDDDLDPPIQDGSDNTNNTPTSSPHISSSSASLVSDFVYQAQVLDASPSPIDFCSSENKRMNKTNGYQHRTQRCIATIEETTLDGDVVRRELDPTTASFDPTCKLAPNFANIEATREENCCTCKIGYTAGWSKAPRDYKPSDNRPYNEYNNCRLCSSYGTFIFPQPSPMIVGLLMGDREGYNKGVDALIAKYNASQVNITYAQTDAALWDRRHDFMAEFLQQISQVGDFNDPTINAIYAEPRFISLVGDKNSLFNTDSPRRDDYIPENGDLVITATFSGLCANGKDDSLSAVYSPWKYIREDLVLPKVPSTSTDDNDWNLPFNPLGMPITEITETHTKNAVSIKSRLSSSSSSSSSPTMMNSAASAETSFAFGVTADAKNKSALYNTDLFQNYFLTNITTQEMYSPTCANYYSCPHGRTPFVHSIDDIDTSNKSTVAVILISLAVLVLNVLVIFVCCFCISKDSQRKAYYTDEGEKAQASDTADENTALVDTKSSETKSSDQEISENKPLVTNDSSSTTHAPQNDNSDEVELQAVS